MAGAVLAGVGFSLDKVHGMREVNRPTKALCPRHVGLVPGGAIAFDKPSRPPANSQELSLLPGSGPPQASLLIARVIVVMGGGAGGPRGAIRPALRPARPPSLRPAAAARLPRGFSALHCCSGFSAPTDAWGALSQAPPVGLSGNCARNHAPLYCHRASSAFPVALCPPPVPPSHGRDTRG